MRAWPLSEFEVLKLKNGVVTLITEPENVFDESRRIEPHLLLIESADGRKADNDITQTVITFFYLKKKGENIDEESYNQVARIGVSVICQRG